MFVLCYFVEPLGHFNSTSQCCVYSDETTCIIMVSAVENTWRCLGTPEPVPLVRVPKPPTIRHQPAT